VIVVGFGLVLGLPLRVALITGMTLAQAGEFMFVLLRAADGTELVDETLGARLMAAAILSMLVTPLLMYLSPRVAEGVSEAWLLRWLGRKREAPQDVAAPLRNHVIIAGYGVAGEELAEALRGREIPYVVVDLNAETVKLLGMQGEPAYFGDVTSPEVLERLGIHRAAELVVAINDPSAALRAVLAARRLAPELPVLVRVRYVGEVQELLDAGATRVIPSEYESAVEIIARVLSRHGVPPNDIVDHVERMHARYRGRT